MKKLLSSLFVLFLFLQIQAQQTTFSKVLYNDSDFGFEGQSIVSSFDSGYLVAGRSGALSEIDSYGDPVWGKTITNTDQDYSTRIDFSSIISTTDSCYFLAGTTGNVSTGRTDGVILKIGPDGQILSSGTLYNT